MAEEIKDENLEVENETTEEIETEEVNSSAEKDVSTESTKEVETDTVEETESEDGKTVPYSRFKEVNDKYKELKAELDALKNGSGQEAEAETQNEVVTNEEENTENVNPLQEKVSKYEAVFNQMFESKIQQVPEEYRDLIPDVDDLQKLAWIENAISKGLFTKNVQDFGNRGANPAEQEEVSNTKFIKNLGRKF